MIDTSAMVGRFRELESLAIIPRVSSTNLVARRIVRECIVNHVSLPKAAIIAGEQFAGRGRNERTWSSPAGKGIYATILVARKPEELSLMPLEMANIVARFLRDTFSIDARIKWPNDVLVGGRKIAGILIEARVQEPRAFLAVGIGINVEPVSGDDRPNAITIRESASGRFGGIEAATIAFLEAVDAGLAAPMRADQVIERWRELSVHRPGDSVTCKLGDREVAGAWSGIDDGGRAILTDESGTTIAVSAGEIIMT